MCIRDRPLFGHFLSFTGVDRPSREDVLRTMPVTADDALASVAPRSGDEVVFLKHMATTSKVWIGGTSMARVTCTWC